MMAFFDTKVYVLYFFILNQVWIIYFLFKRFLIIGLDVFNVVLFVIKYIEFALRLGV